MHYQAPVQEMMFLLQNLADLDELSQLPNYGDASADTVEAVLEEFARFTSQVIAPLNYSGDCEGASLSNGVVTTASGFKEAFKQFAEAGWQGLPHNPDYGGMGLPKVVAAACTEMLNAANLSFALCPLLTDGAIDALEVAGTAEQKEYFITQMVAGNWTGTMNLTEPQAGSDLSQVKTKAVLHQDGVYRIKGQKIYITYGDHDLAENIIHLVLARTPGAPEGVKGLSLFLVPKFLTDDDQVPGKRNAVHCASLEHKLGIKASPTAVLIYGEKHGDVGDEGAIGYLLGEENKGLQYMFVMMNAARYQVGIQGIGLADRAYQHALDYAKNRLQSKPVDGSSDQPVAIVNHPDVKRMLLSMRAQVQAARALAIFAGYANDLARSHTDQLVKNENQKIYEFLVPVVKGWSTEMSIEVASTGVQVFGGMGYVEETGAAQYYRDAKILTIYEGTTAIQANDLIGRKTIRDQGAVAQSLSEKISLTVEDLKKIKSEHALAVASRLEKANQDFSQATQFVVSQGKTQPNSVYAGSVPFLKLVGITVSGWLLAKTFIAAHEAIENGSNDTFYNEKMNTVLFYSDYLLSTTTGIKESIVFGYRSVVLASDLSV